MSTETTDLVALFSKNDGGRHTWRYKNVDTSLPAEEIKEACELLTTLDLFEQDGVKLFDSALSAKFVTTIETLIFDLEHEPEELTPEIEPPMEATCEEVGCFEVIDESEKTGNDLATKATSINPLSVQPLGRHYDRLTRIETIDAKEATITINKDSLPPINHEPPVEIIGYEYQQQEADIHQATDTDIQDTTKNKGLFHRLFRRRSRNKDAPESTPRE
ncbi:DUF2922 family protein [Enterococcus sp. DIV0756]|uniref:DUF2922 family protein n=1 Tax=Enterococcus sp. DIV0756 TaxID=2774636 RepID=UPI003F27D600